MSRITRHDLEERAANVNRRIESTGRIVSVQGRNGYVGLDEYTSDGAMVRTITCGTTREIGDFLFAMMAGIDLSRVAADLPSITTDLDFNCAYRVEGYRGVAWRLVGYEMIRDEDYEWSGIEEEDREHARMVMVGDDRIFTFDVEDVEPISEDDYCSGCGQIGCKAC